MPVPTIKPKTTGRVETTYLDFDPNNPRLIELGFKAPTDAQIIRALADTADLSEIVESIAANGYIDIEPMIVQRVKNRFVVLEGNRRLAAIRLLLNHDLAQNTGISVPTISKQVRDSLNEVTVYAVSNPDQARDFIGFKHINGPHKWDAHAKGRFAADWYRKEKTNGLTLERIAQRLGDRHDTVLRLVNGIYVLDQAEKERVFSVDERYPGRKFAFSHLYTALTRPGYREYLGLPEEWRTTDPKPNPVPKDRISHLEKVMTWLYGSKADEVEPVITSQNPHIKQLGAVLQDARARAILINSRSLSEAHAQLEPKGARFEQALLTAKQEAENALSQVIGFDPDDSTLLETADELKRASAVLFTTMSTMASQSKAKSRK
jgi:ParB/Sulfiredoxin domain